MDERPLTTHPPAGQGKSSSSAGAASSSSGKGGGSGHAGPVLSRLTGGLFVPGTGPASPLLLTAAGLDGGLEGGGCNGVAGGGGGEKEGRGPGGGEEPVGFASFQVKMKRRVADSLC
jgi:hypothetical protein